LPSLMPSMSIIPSQFPSLSPSKSSNVPSSLPSLMPQSAPPQVCFCTAWGLRKVRAWGIKSCAQLGCPSIFDPVACHNKNFQAAYPSKIFCEYKSASPA